MSQKTPENGQNRPLRRSTRIDQPVPFKVTGVDSYRGPYCEQVTAETISCHGCRFKSKYDVPINSEVMLELKNEMQAGQPVFARGAVKSLQRRRERDQDGLFCTSIELEEPGNIWSVVSPPEDWLPFCHPRKPIRAYLKPTMSVPPEDVKARAPVGDAVGVERSLDSKSAPSLPSIERPLSQIMLAFQRQMEEMLSKAAAAAAQKEAISLREELREEAKGMVAEAAAAHIEKHSLELAALSKSVSASFLEQLGRLVEASRRDAVDRIVGRLKEQLAVPLEEARTAIANLAKAKEDLERILGEIAQKSSTGSEEFRTRFEGQMETSIRAHLCAAGVELDRASQSTMHLTLASLDASAKQYEALACVHLNEALDQVSETALTVWKEKSAAVSRQSAEALTTDSCRYLELLGNGISELAKGLGKRSPPL
ncbi:MAG: hypothetical protein ABSA57_20990 [Candidatus Acidiferrales bacterium]|jgi:hypothetical protein